MDERGQFTFYKSYWDAIESLPAKDRLPIMEAIIKYALFGEEPASLSTIRRAVFLLVKPTLDSSRKKAASGKQGGSKPKANGSKPKANGSEKEKEKEKEKEIEIEIEGENDKEQTGSAPMDGRSFTDFWKNYPAGKGGDREEAWKAWKELAPSTAVAWRILDGLKDWVSSEQWEEDGGRYIPGAAKFLREKRWLSPPSVGTVYEDSDGPYSDTMAYVNEILARKKDIR